METTTFTPTNRAPARPEPSLGDVFEDVLPIVGVVFVAGPPVLVSGAVAALLALMVIGALTLIITLLAVAAAAALLAGLAGAVFVVPYRAVRRRRETGVQHQSAELPPTPIAARWTAAWRSPDQPLLSPNVPARI